MPMAVGDGITIGVPDLQKNQGRVQSSYVLTVGHKVWSSIIFL